jgi:hypothetical protein
MGGFERLIAFKTSKEVDIAVGQVESNILRETKAYPPEKWWPRFPIIEYKEPIVYRRTVIFVKAEPQDYFVFWDQYWAPKDVKAVYCLHALDDQTVAEKAKQGATTDGSDLFRWPQADVPRPEGLERGRLLLYRKGSDHPEAYDITAVEKDGLRLSGKPEAGENLGYAILKDRITLPTPNPNALKLKAGSVYLYAIGPYENVYSHPWWHENGGLEQTQGVRLPYYGRVGAILTVMSPTPLAVEGAPGFVGVGGDSGDAIQFGEADKSPKADAVYVTVKRGRKTLIELTGKDFDFDRPQGEIGLLAPDAVAPHGDIPEWLLKQRANPPAWRRW